MTIATYEGVVRKGQNFFKTNIALPDETRVYIIVPEIKKPKTQILSPHFVHREDASRFRMEVDIIEDKPDAKV